MQGEFWIANSPSTLASVHAELEKLWHLHKYLTVQISIGKPRTPQQRKALEVYCRMVADELNRNGITFTKFFREGYSVPWSQEIVKDNVWRPMQIAMTGKKSTTEAATTEYPQIYDAINLKLSEHGIHVPWPEKDHASSSAA